MSEESGLERAVPPKAVIARARAAFRDRFGGEVEFGGVAPGRINLIGEHTDYNGGLVLPMAIDRVCVAAAAPGSRAGRWRVHAADLGQDAEFNVGRAIEPGAFAKGLWSSYVGGVAAKMRDAIGSDDGLPPLDIVITSSVPPGGGLASSAALTVSIATMLEAAMAVQLEPLEKARLCQQVEHHFAGVPCGIMDPLVSVMGREGHALLIDCEDESVTPVRLPRASEAVVLVIDSGVRHSLAGGEYAKRREACESAARKLGAGCLRHVTAVALARCEGLTDEERRCARHVLSENERVTEAAAALDQRDLARLGDAMNRSHDSLRDEYRVSCVEVDAIVEALRAVPGVLGARMTGAGFGGCVIALGRPETVSQASTAATSLGRSASVVLASHGARFL